MSFRNKKIPLLEEGCAKSIMSELFTIFKSHYGLTRYQQTHGVNGCWMNPDEPYNISALKISKMLENAARFRHSDEAFMKEWEHMGKFVLKTVKTKK